MRHAECVVTVVLFPEHVPENARALVHSGFWLQANGSGIVVAARAHARQRAQHAHTYARTHDM